MAKQYLTRRANQRHSIIITPRPLLVGRRPGVAIGPAAFTRQRNACLGPDLMARGGAELEHLQLAAEQVDLVSRLRALIAAVDHARGKDVIAALPADRDILRPQRDAHLVVDIKRV